MPYKSIRLAFRSRLHLSVPLLLALCSCGDSSPRPHAPESDQRQPAALDVHIRTSPVGPEYVLGDRSTRDADVLAGWIKADGLAARTCLHAPHSIDSRTLEKLVNQLSAAGVEVAEFHGHP